MHSKLPSKERQVLRTEPLAGKPLIPETATSCRAFSDSSWGSMQDSLPGCSCNCVLVHSSTNSSQVPHVEGYPSGAGGTEPTCQCRRCKRCGFNPWIGDMPWRRAWQPTSVFLPGESHGQRSLQATVHGVAKSQTWLKRISMHTAHVGWAKHVYDIFVHYTDKRMSESLLFLSF